LLTVTSLWRALEATLATSMQRSSSRQGAEGLCENPPAPLAVKLDRRSFSYYDIDLKQWHIDPGEFDIFVGQSVGRSNYEGNSSLRKMTSRTFES
jgi:hypothetical protein